MSRHRFPVGALVRLTDEVAQSRGYNDEGVVTRHLDNGRYGVTWTGRLSPGTWMDGTMEMDESVLAIRKEG